LDKLKNDDCSPVRIISLNRSFSVLTPAGTWAGTHFILNDVLIAIAVIHRSAIGSF
jgi:hypothetical protein